MTAYKRVLNFCDDEMITLEELEKINHIPVGSIEKWKKEKPELKDFSG